jgi:arsenate reductase
MKVYGISNCNTVKKAITWLTENDLAFEFHDFKKKGITEEKLNQWCGLFGWEIVLNKKGTTWKKLSPEVQSGVVDHASAVAVMIANTSSIKRPVVEVDGKPVLISFNEEAYVAALK